MLAQAGLFDRAPVTRRIIYNFMRLRAVTLPTVLMLAAGPALAAGATSEGATALGKTFSAYFGEAAISRGIISRRSSSTARSFTRSN